MTNEPLKVRETSEQLASWQINSLSHQYLEDNKKYELIERSRLDELLEIEAMYKGLQK